MNSDPAGGLLGVVGFDRSIAGFAASQEGAFSHLQALACGASDTMISDRVDSGRWLRVEKGVYVIGGSHDSWRRRLFVATLGAGPGSAVSHRAAGEIWGLARFG